MLSPAYESTVAMLEAAQLGAQRDVAEHRAAFDGLAQLLPLPASVKIEESELGGVAVEWLIPEDNQPPRVAVLWLHGGGYTIGSRASHRPAAARLAAALGHPVVVAEYRRAPEHPHPAALDDARAVWRALLDNGWDAATLGLVGDSAGGGLALALMIDERDAGGHLPGAASLLCPWVDLTGSHPRSPEIAARDVVLSIDQLEMWAKGYKGSSPAEDPRISPLFADLAGLPSLLIDTGGRDILRDDATRLAARAEAAGLSVDLHVSPEMIHIWHVFAGAFPEADEALARVAGWLQARLVG